MYCLQSLHNKHLVKELAYLSEGNLKTTLVVLQKLFDSSDAETTDELLPAETIKFMLPVFKLSKIPSG